jgi:hypothetical protein
VTIDMIVSHRSTDNLNVGSNFDLQKLKLSKSAYSIEDGDIPCTFEVEPTFG